MSQQVPIRSYQSVINRKTDPTIINTNVLKTNRHGKEDRRLLIATYSSFIICNSIKIFRSFKISRQIAWVDLRKLSFEEPNKIIFSFKYEVVQISVDDPKTLLETLVVHFYRMFGSELPIMLQISPYEINPPNEPFKFMFSSLFMSYCHSMLLPENEYLINALIANYENTENLKIDLVLLKPDAKYLPAIVSALWYSENIQTLSISQGSIADFFSFLKHIVNRNCSTLESISIYDCSKFDKFDEFSNSLMNSYIHTISFYDILFPANAIERFIDYLPQTTITEVYFYSCPFSTKVWQLFQMNAISFSKLTHFSIHETTCLSENHGNFELCMNFLFEAKISSISLVDVNLDITDIFERLHQSNFPVIALDLSKNICSSKFTGLYTLPVTLIELKLASIHWSATALYNLLMKQNYVNQISLDISSQFDLRANNVMTENSQALVEMHRALKPANLGLNIFSLTWDFNTLSVGFFRYLSNMMRLIKLSINCCVCEGDDSVTIMNTIVLYLQNSRIEEFSIKGSPHLPYKDLVCGLFAVIGAHQTLQVLDVSNNNIGDSGLDLLVDCVARNKQISQISFEGSKLQSPQKFIDNCQRLAEMHEHLKYVVKPRKDIAELTKMEELRQLEPGSVIKAWNKLKETMKKVSPKIEEVPSDQLITVKKTTLNDASWDIEIKVPFNREPNGWDPLRNLFSLQVLTGIPPDEQESLIIL